MSVAARRVAVTGMGVVSPAGSDLASFWDTLVAGRSTVRPLSRFDASGYPTRIAAEVPGEPLADADRVGRFALSASAAALADAGLEDGPLDRGRVGVLVAAGLGRYGHAEVFGPCAAARAGSGAFDREAFARALAADLGPRAAERRTPGSVPALIARRHGFSGPVMSVMTACAAGTQALGDAARWIRSGVADVVLAGGSDSEIYPMGLASFCLLGALSTRNAEPAAASRPFDADRDGFVLGEGAGVLVFEEWEHARRRGARIWAEVSGFGSACDSFRVTDPHPDGTGAVLAMERALADAHLLPGAVGYVNAHGTSTVANDRIETRALKQVFGEDARRLPVSSTKSMIGHLTVAAGAVEAIATVLTLARQTIHPTANLERPDPECDLDYVPGASREARVVHALSNSFAFGGQCASLVLSRPA
jgi:3-oxoacyl-[acyl-carrier-protein] synthase II